MASKPVLPFLASPADDEPTAAAVGTEPISMTKFDLIQCLAEKTTISAQRAELVVNAIFACMKQSLLRGERIEIRGFGTFQVRSYKGYTGRNPSTGNSVYVAPKRLPFFKVGKNLVAKMNDGRKRKGSMESVRS